MIVTCESCRTKFRLDLERIKKPQIKVRCSNCGHVFMVTKTKTEDTDDAVLGFEMPPIDEPEEGAADSPAISAPYSPTTVKSRAKTRLMVKWIVVIVLFCAMGGGAYWLFRSGLLSRGPVNHRQMNTLHPADAISQVVIDQDIQSYFLENSHAGQIFVVEGKVVNKSAKPVSFILVEGKLFTTNNEVARSQRCYCGNVISKDQLKEMDMNEIQDTMMNREGRKLSNVHVKPQGEVPFMIVFHNLPELDLLTDYSVEVVSAEFEE